MSGLSEVNPAERPDQREIDELDADIIEFIGRSDEIFFGGGPLGVEDAQNFEAELADFLRVDSIVDRQALSRLKDDDFASNGIDGLIPELSSEAQTRLTALVIGLGPQRIEAMTLLTDIGLRSDPANDKDNTKSAISFKDYLGGLLPVSLLAGRQVEVNAVLPPEPIAGTTETTAGAAVSAATEAFDHYFPSATGRLATVSTVANGVSGALYLVSVASVGKEIVDGEFFNSGNDTLEAISVVSGGIALIPGPWSLPAAGVSATSGIASIFVSETDMVDRPVDELFSALDEQLSGLENELMQLREDSSDEVNFHVAQQLGQRAGPLTSLDAADQETLNRRLELEVQLGAPTDAELATASLNRSRTNEIIDAQSLVKVANRLFERVQAETWRPVFPPTIDVRDQRSDKIYSAVVPEHIQSDPWLLGPDLHFDFKAALADIDSIDAEIARVRQQYG